MIQVAANGSNPHRLGDLKPPTNYYSSLIKPFELGTRIGGTEVNGARGGHFWDGRAEGRHDGALFPETSTKHIGSEVFQNITDPKILEYAKYFGPIADQALGPMPNPAEHNIKRKGVCRHVRKSNYTKLYELAWGEKLRCGKRITNIKAEDVAIERRRDISFKRLMLAVSAWQHSNEVNSFTSKRDKALRQELACINPEV